MLGGRANNICAETTFCAIYPRSELQIGKHGEKDIENGAAPLENASARVYIVR